MFTRLLFPGFFQRPTVQAREPIFMHNTSNDVVPRKDVFSGLENKNLTFKPLTKNRHLGPDFDRTRFRPNQLYVGENWPM